MNPALPQQTEESWPGICARYGNVRGISHTASRNCISGTISKLERSCCVKSAREFRTRQ